jgi:hypothetical protein
MILWDVLYRCQQAITLAFTEDIWTRNILNVFVTPVRTSELLLATSLLGVIKSLIPALLLGALAYGFYSFDVRAMGLHLAPFLFSLLLFGWAVGITAALIPASPIGGGAGLGRSSISPSRRRSTRRRVAPPVARSPRPTCSRACARPSAGKP